MNISIRLAAIILTCLLLTITLMPACDDDETPAPTQIPIATSTTTAKPTATTEPTSAPEPTSGNEETSWKYRANYANQEEVFSLNLVGEETLDSIDCYVIEANYDEPLIRTAATGNPLDIISGKYWVSKSTLDEVKTEGNIKANKMIDLSSVVTATYATTNHGAPLAVGKKWEVDRLTHLEPQLLQDSITTLNIEVIAEESVTVPVGTFNCYKLEYVVTAKDDVPAEIPAIVKTEWWSVDENMPVAIKIEDYATYDQTETRELVPADYTAETGSVSTEAVVESDYETTSAFRELMDLISNTDRVFLEGARAVKDETSVIEGYQFLTQVLTVALNCYIWGDSARPEFVPLTSPTLKWGGDNADSVYNFAPIDPNRTYRVSGELGDAVYFSLTVYGGPDDGRWSDRIVGTLNNLDMTINTDGRFEIILSPDEYEGNWMKLDPDAVALVTRDYRHHPGTDRLTTLQIEAIDTVPPPRLTDAEVAQRFRKAMNFASDLFNLFPMAVNTSHQMITQINYVEEPYPIPEHTVGWAAGDASYAIGNFDLQEDEALIIEGTSPECVFWNMCLWNPYLQTYDYRYEQVTINDGQVQYEPDGSWRIVIAHSDPGVPNWISTAGHQYGLVWFRWFLPESIPEQPQAEVVKLSDL